jgi:hypothetical protein
MYEVLLELDDLLETLTYWLSFAAVALSVIVVAAYVWHKAAEQKATRVEPRKKKGRNDMKQSEKLMQLLELMQANPELPVIPCVDGDVVGGDEYYCWLGSWGESAVQEFIIGKERTYYREDDICEMNDVLYERYDPELVDNMTDEETRAAYNALPWKKAIFVDVHQYEEEPDAEV